MYVSDEFRLVYLAQPRTASRAVAHLLTTQFGAVDTPTQGSLFGAGHHSAGAEYVQQYRDKGYLTFTVVRNHWDIIVSWWFNNNRSPDWSEWLDYWLYANTNRWKRPHQLYWFMQPMADQVLRYETLQDDLSELLRTQITIPEMGLSPRSHYSHYYTPETAAVVRAHYWQEIEHYGYSYESEHDCHGICDNPRHDLGGHGRRVVVNA